MKGYLDTCIISAIVKSDLKEIEQSALAVLHDKYIAHEVELFTSEHVEEELNKIPLQYRQEHLNILSLFTNVPKVRVGGLTRLGPVGPTANPKHRQMSALTSLLPDKDDALHIFIASSNRILWFITSDERTVIKHSKEVKNICGVEAVLPSKFLAQCSMAAT